MAYFFYKKKQYYNTDKKSIIFSKSICDKKIIIADMDKNGPKGISCVFFTLSNISDIGSARNAAKKTDIIERGNPKTKPNTASNFISPPPMDSFLNKKSPSIFNTSINTNEPNACKSEIPIASNPPIKYFININNNEKNIKILSGIIIV